MKVSPEVFLWFGSFGFPLPVFKGIGCKLVSNLKSVLQFPHIVKVKLDKEIKEGRIAGPFNYPPFKNFRVSPLGIISKKEHNSFRLIHHLSFPIGSSLNDEINEELASISYCTFEEAVCHIRKFGKAALLTKADIKPAFRLLPLSPASYNSLGMVFEDKFYYDVPPNGMFNFMCVV